MPNKVNVFGSTYKIVPIEKRVCPKMIKEKVIHIKKIRVKALDNPDQRCATDATKPDTSACIASYIEKEIGCNPMVQGSQYSNRVPCTTKEQLHSLQNITETFEESDGNTLFDITGCLSSCEKDHFTIEEEPEKCYASFGPTGTFFWALMVVPVLYWIYLYLSDDKYKLTFRILDRSYKEEEHYKIYDMASFIADVGGYMGLLLGCSLMSLYSEMEAFMMNLMCRPQSQSGFNLC